MWQSPAEPSLGSWNCLPTLPLSVNACPTFSRTSPARMGQNDYADSGSRILQSHHINKTTYLELKLSSARYMANFLLVGV